MQREDLPHVARSALWIDWIKRRSRDTHDHLTFSCLGFRYVGHFQLLFTTILLNLNRLHECSFPETELQFPELNCSFSLHFSRLDEGSHGYDAFLLLLREIQ